jgi:hypothetical protein
MLTASWLSGEPLPDDSLDIGWILQRLQLANLPCFIRRINRELVSPGIRPGGEDDPPRQRVGLAEPIVWTVSLVQRVDNENGRRVPFGQETLDRGNDLRAAQIRQVVDRARNNCLTNVAGGAGQTRTSGVKRQLNFIESTTRCQAS